jgi:hypothetical protein
LNFASYLESRLTGVFMILRTQLAASGVEAMPFGAHTRPIVPMEQLWVRQGGSNAPAVYATGTVQVTDVMDIILASPPVGRRQLHLQSVERKQRVTRQWVLDIQWTGKRRRNRRFPARLAEHIRARQSVDGQSPAGLRRRLRARRFFR